LENYVIKVDATQYPYLDEVEWEELRECPCCGHSTPFLPLWEYVLKDKKIIFQTCPQCGVGLLNPRMSDRFTERFYKEFYAKYHHKWNDKEKELQQFRANVFSLLLKDTGRNKHLDIGSSAGFIVDTLHDRLGCEGTGIEPDEWYRLYAKEHHHGRYVESLDELDSEKFDLITMCHVLEHMNYPLEYLQEISERFLSDDGMLVIEVPNSDAYVASFLLHHPIAFEEKSIKYLLRKIGFTNISIIKHNGNTPYPTKLYLMAIAWREKITPSE
jgi:2-polyprenyl-3-methyl-5-hydroxy-6-metoxy-1,4-benzoquinol methylase